MWREQQGGLVDIDLHVFSNGPQVGMVDIIPCKTGEIRPVTRKLPFPRFPGRASEIPYSLIPYPRGDIRGGISHLRCDLCQLARHVDTNM